MIQYNKVFFKATESVVVGEEASSFGDLLYVHIFLKMVIVGDTDKPKEGNLRADLFIRILKILEQWFSVIVFFAFRGYLDIERGCVRITISSAVLLS